MQTFLPYPDFLDSAKVLDKKRCWKQVVEAKQIINALEAKYNKALRQKVRPIGWINHPAVKMWEGHIHELKIYFNAFLFVCLEKHRINTKYGYYPVVQQHLQQQYEFPWWLGNKNFHRAMRARLIEKDEAFYLPLFPEDKGFNNGKYLWPVMETKTFRII